MFPAASRRLFRRCYPRQKSGIYRRREDDYDGSLIASDFLIADSGGARSIDGYLPRPEDGGRRWVTGAFHWFP
jgi:hypothetical protein